MTGRPARAQGSRTTLREVPLRERHPLAVLLAPDLQRLGLPSRAAAIFTTALQLGTLLGALPLAALAGRLGALLRLPARRAPPPPG